MSGLDRKLAREQLVEVLGDCVYHALGLKQSLQDEFRALQDQDMDGLGAAVDNKSRCTHTLESLDETRRSVCAEAGFEAGPEQMQQMIEWCDNDSAVAGCWQHLLDIATECVSLNITNGAIIRSRSEHIDTNLDVLRGGTGRRETYTPKGLVPGTAGARSLAEA